MSIVKLTPAFKDYLWGGTKLKENYGKKTDMDPVAELSLIHISEPTRH